MHKTGLFSMYFIKLLHSILPVTAPSQQTTALTCPCKYLLPQGNCQNAIATCPFVRMDSILTKFKVVRYIDFRIQNIVFCENTTYYDYICSDLLLIKHT